MGSIPTRRPTASCPRRTASRCRVWRRCLASRPSSRSRCGRSPGACVASSRSSAASCTAPRSSSSRRTISRRPKRPTRSASSTRARSCPSARPTASSPTWCRSTSSSTPRIAGGCARSSPASSFAVTEAGRCACTSTRVTRTPRSRRSTRPSRSCARTCRASRTRIWRSWGKSVSEVAAVLTLAHRDLIKLLRDRARIVSDFAFPLIFIGILGTSLQSGFGSTTGINLLHFVFTGVLAQTIWQSTALGVISLLMDREQDFSQEIFVSPISRYSIIFGKILGESLVAFPQFIAILAFGLILGVPFTLEKIVALIPAALIIAVYGGAFGVLVLSRLENKRQANQIFPFVMLPQFFLAGIFNPIQNLPWFLDILSKIAPMRYAVDLMRDVYYSGGPNVPIFDLPTNLAIIGVEFLVFIVVGTAGFVRAERNR